MAAQTSQSKSGAKEPTVEDLNEQIEQLRADMKSIADTLGAIASGKAGEVSAEARRRAADLEAEGRAALQRAGDAARGLEADLAAHVRERPLQSLAIAAGLGVIFGLFSRR